MIFCNFLKFWHERGLRDLFRDANSKVYRNEMESRSKIQVISRIHIKIGFYPFKTNNNRNTRTNEKEEIQKVLKLS